jgi:hypothetical protein
MGTGGSSPGVKRPGRETDHSPPTSARVKKLWIIHYPTRFQGTNLPFLLAQLSVPEKAGVTITLYTCIWQVLGSNIGRDTEYPKAFRNFPYSPHSNVGIMARLRNDYILPHPLGFILFANHATPHNLDNDCVVKQATSAATTTVYDQNCQSWLINYSTMSDCTKYIQTSFTTTLLPTYALTSPLNSFRFKFLQLELHHLLSQAKDTNDSLNFCFKWIRYRMSLFYAPTKMSGNWIVT